jgi:hypothetical protein
MKKFYIILIIVLVLGLTWYITMQPKPAQEVIVPVPEQVTTTPEPAVAGAYTNNTLGVSAQLPTGYTIDNNYAYTVNPQRSIPGVKFTIPKSISQGTNLGSDSYVSIERVSGSKSCTADYFLDGSHTAANKAINGKTYSVATSTGAGAGNRYEESVFVFPRSDSCVAVRYYVHYSALENYEPGTVKQYNTAALMNQFDSIRDSVTITN